MADESGHANAILYARCRWRVPGGIPSNRERESQKARDRATGPNYRDNGRFAVASDAAPSATEAEATGEGSGNVDSLIFLATFLARLWVARKLLPKKWTSPSTVSSRTTLPSRAQSWLRTFSLVAPLTVVTARLVSLPAVYFCTVVFRSSKFGTSLALALRSPLRNTCLNCFVLPSSSNRFS